jgi:type III restriction enzyme
VLVINIDAFRKTLDDMEDEKKSNIIHRENDRLSGRKPIEFIQATNPIVIVDEPQSVDSTDKAREAIRTLNPLCTLRYSATHRAPYNLLYKLDPIKAYEMRLVKRIEVASVMSEGSFNDAFITLDSVDRRAGISAKVIIHQNARDGSVKEKKLKVKMGDDLFHKSNEREAYRYGYIVEEINTEEGFEYIRFSSGRELELGASQGGLTDEIMRVQIRNTIEEHLKKEKQVKEQGIKVLSLFFIDKVANYRSYDGQGNEVRGKFAKWFEEEYKELTSKPRFKDVIPYPVEKLHDGYFSVDKKGKAKDTKGNTQADEDAYNLIMKEKERLLSPEEPLRFIFSHSALREGWDNPNVFQICTLNVTKSEIKKRQEIGRGLRLPVDTNGERVFSDNINKLTVIANESYKDFAKKLQTEIEEDFGVKFGIVKNIAFANVSQTIDGEVVEVGKEKSEKIWKELKDNGYIDKEGNITSRFNPKDPDFELNISAEHDDIKPAIIDTIKSHQFEGHIVDKKSRQPVRLNKEVYLDDDFKALWDSISQKTTYSVEYDTQKLIESASEGIRRMDAIEAIRIQTTKVDVDVTKAGVETQEILHRTTKSETKNKLPDILAYLQNQKETELTRSTLAEILIRSGRLGDFIKNPQLFIDNVTKCINRELHRFMIEGIKYEKIDGDMYEMRLFQKEVLAYLHNLIEVQKSVYDYVEYDSEVERQFAKDLDNMEEVKLFVKLPSWFKVATPISTYNPDWAIVKQGDDTLYLVRETKSTLDKDKRRKSENDKITCAEKHFDEIEVDFKVVAKARDI